MNQNLSGAELAAAEETKKSHRRVLKVLIISGVALLVLAALAAAYFYLSPGFGFKTVGYDNNKGDKFRLEFYASHVIKTAPGTNGAKELASNVSVGGLYPLAIFISKTPQKPTSELLNCTGVGVSPTALQVTSRVTGNKINLCSVYAEGAPTKAALYVGVLQSGAAYYAIVVQQDVDFAELNRNPENARAGLKKINLPAYNNDIIRIVSSIRPE